MASFAEFLLRKRPVSRLEFWAATLAGSAALAVFALAGLSLVAAVTFDSDLVPSTGNTFKLGVSSADWQSINNTIFFSGSNVGIGSGASTPNTALQVDGGVRLNTTASRPTCDSSVRGTFWVTQNGAGVQDNVNVCVKNSSDVYTWATIY